MAKRPMSNFPKVLLPTLGLLGVALLLLQRDFMGSSISQRKEVQKQFHNLTTFETVPSRHLRAQRSESAGPFLGDGDFPVDFDKFSLAEAQLLVHKKITETPFKCLETVWIGRPGDGGYHVCTQEPFQLKPGCLVYSFGINNEWSFDEGMRDIFGCEVHSFDPSMDVGDHMHSDNIHFHNLGVWGRNFRNDKGWELRDLRTIMQMLNHTNRVLDFVKIDVEGAEWSLIEHIVRSGVHTHIRQMAFEVHTPRYKGDAMSLTDYGEVFTGQQGLENVGFRKYMQHTRGNCCGKFAAIVAKPVANITLKHGVCCYELFYVNKNFIHP